MDVLVVSHMYPWDHDPRSGIFVHRQVQALVDRGHRVRVISPTPWCPPVDLIERRFPPYNDLPKKRTLDRIEVTYVRYLSLPGQQSLPVNSRSARLSLRLSVRRALTGKFEPDVVNSHVVLPDAYAAEGVANALSVPHIVTVHGTDFYSFAEIPKNRSLIGKTLTAADHIILNSPQLKTLGTDLFGEKVMDGSTVIANGVPMEKIREAKTIDPSHFPDNGRPTIVTAAELIHRKRQSVVLDAIAGMKPPRPNLICIGEGPLRDDLRRQADSLGIDHLVTFLEIVEDHAEFFAYMDRADLFVLPSVDEAFGVVYIEAMACGTPVIACRGEGPSSFITHRKNGFLIPPDDAEALSKLLQDCLDQPGMLSEIAERGKQTVERDFTWNENARRVEEVYRQQTDQ